MSSITLIARGAAVKPLFALGRVVATPGAIEALRSADVSALALIHRHVSGDFDDLCESDREANVEALGGGLRVFSVYRIGSGLKLYVITEADRSVTTLLLPSEY